jgi:hypothetical protein
MVTDIFRNKSFMQPVRRLNMHPPRAKMVMGQSNWLIAKEK